MYNVNSLFPRESANLFAVTCIVYSIISGHFPHRHTVIASCCAFPLGLIRWIKLQTWQWRWQPLLFWQILLWVSTMTDICVYLQPLLLLSAITATCCVTCWIFVGSESHRESAAWPLFKKNNQTSFLFIVLEKWEIVGIYVEIQHTRQK